MTIEAREHGGGVGGTSARAAAWLAWSLAGLSVVMFGATVALASVTLLTADEPTSGLIGEVALFAPLLSFPIVGGVISSKRPENAIGWICLAAGLFWMLIGVQEAYDAYGRVWTPVLLDAALQWIWVPPVGLLGIYMILLFPDGRLPSRRWRPFAWFAGALMTTISVGFAFVPGPLVERDGVRNPLGIEQLAWVEGVAVFVVLLLPFCILVSASSLVFRYRRSPAGCRASRVGAIRGSSPSGPRAAKTQSPTASSCPVRAPRGRLRPALPQFAWARPKSAAVRLRFRRLSGFYSGRNLD